MLSVIAYQLLNLIAEGELSAHDLHTNLSAFGLSAEDTDRRLFQSLCELVDGEHVAWALHERWGEPPLPENRVRPRKELEQAWARCFARGGPGSVGPFPTQEKPGTLVFEATKRGVEETFAPCYER